MQIVVLYDFQFFFCQSVIMPGLIMVDHVCQLLIKLGLEV